MKHMLILTEKAIIKILFADSVTQNSLNCTQSKENLAHKTLEPKPCLANLR